MNAVLTLFGLVELGIPLALGLIADRAGLTWALALLGLQPLGLALLASFGFDRDFVAPDSSSS